MRIPEQVSSGTHPSVSETGTPRLLEHDALISCSVTKVSVSPPFPLGTVARRGLSIQSSNHTACAPSRSDSTPQQTLLLAGNWYFAPGDIRAQRPCRVTVRFPVRPLALEGMINDTVAPWKVSPSRSISAGAGPGLSVLFLQTSKKFLVPRT